ncbi:unnamed protein product [Laminaria digitata]
MVYAVRQLSQCVMVGGAAVFDEGFFLRTCCSFFASSLSSYDYGLDANEYTPSYQISTWWVVLPPYIYSQNRLGCCSFTRLHFYCCFFVIFCDCQTLHIVGWQT